MFQVAIVGRPNVGKSTLFNRLCGFRKSIVGDEPGITRDRIYGSVEWNNKSISFLDTGGLMPDTHEIIPEQILSQVETALSESQLVLMVVDGRAGITPLDEQLLADAAQERQAGLDDREQDRCSRTRDACRIFL